MLRNPFNNKAKYLETIDMYALSNEEAISNVMQDYGYDAEPSAETILLCVIAQGEPFIVDLWGNTEDGENLPADNLDDFESYLNTAAECLMQEDMGDRKGTRVMGMKKHHVHIAVIVVVLIVIGYVVWRKYVK